MSIDIILRKNLRFLRSIHNDTQEKAAEKAGISDSNYRAIEERRVTPKITTIAKIANGYGLEAGELLLTNGSMYMTEYERHILELVHSLDLADQERLSAVIDSLVQLVHK